MALSPELKAKIAYLKQAQLAKLKAQEELKVLAQKSEIVQVIEKLPSPETTESPPWEEESTKEIRIQTPEQAFQDSFTTTLDRYGNTVSLNEKQAEFVKTAATGNSCVLIGAAGTGKTTCQYAVTRALIQGGKCGQLSAEGHKTLKTGTPGIVICAYTRRAVANIKRSVSLDLQGNCLTIHKLLQYQPVIIEVDAKDDLGMEYRKNSMRFEPFYTAGNPLPSSIKTIIIEEASMLGMDLWEKLMAACPHNPQIIFLGDIQQLPPTFGSAILGYKLLELPVVELTQVYRQALESPILSLAWKLLRGEELSKDQAISLNVEGKLTIKPWKKKIHEDVGCGNSSLFMIQAMENELYDPDEDMILIPQNVGFGTIEVNKKIANHIARKRGRITYHIRAGFKDHYLSVGDKAMYDKEDCYVKDIYPNPNYVGKNYNLPSPTLDYWGNDSSNAIHDDEDELAEAKMEKLLLQTSGESEDEGRTQQASHCVELEMSNSDQIITVKSAGDMNKILLGYALTVHKAQGSEWNRVFFISHNIHNRMLQRELVYTAITRAKEELVVICEPDMWVRASRSQKIKGNTLAEKAEYFKGKVAQEEDEKLPM